MADQNSVQQALQEAWAQHKAGLRIEPVDADDAKAGIGVVRDDGQYLDCTFLFLYEDNRMRGWQSVIRRDLARKPMNVLAQASRKTARGHRMITPRETFAWLGIDGSEPELADASVTAFRENLADQSLRARVQGDLFDNLKQLEIKRLRKAGLDRFRESYVSAAISALSCVDQPGWSDYSFYASAKKGEIRREQARIFPVVADALARRPNVRFAIDEQAPLKPALQTGMGLSKGVQKRLQEREYPVTGMDGTTLARYLGRVQPDWVPQDIEQWNAFLDVSDSVGRHLADSLGLSTDDLYKGSKGDWVQFRDNLAKAITDTRPPEDLDEASFERLKHARDWKSLTKLDKAQVPGAIDRMVDGLELPDGLDRQTLVDWLNRVYAPDADRRTLQIAAWDAGDLPISFAQTVLVPLVANRVAESTDAAFQIDEGTRSRAFRAAVEILYNGKSASAILETSKRWHNDQFNQQAAMQQEVQDDQRDEDMIGEWPALTAPAQAPNGLWLVPEVTTEQLRHAGQIMATCVGGYVDRCRDRGEHLVSIRTDRHDPNSRLTMAELSSIPLNENAPWEHIRNLQHRGRGNAPADERTQAALDWYLDAIRTQRIEINMADIRNHIANQNFEGPRGGIDRVTRDAGYDWRDDDALENALRTWDPYLDKRFRKMTAVQMANNVEAVRDMITKIAPEFAYDRGLDVATP